MSLAMQHLSENNEKITFSVDELASRLQAFPEIIFAYLLGSAKDGVIHPGSDIDLALYLFRDCKSFIDLYGEICDAMKDILPGVRIDIGQLQLSQDPVYRYESIKGRLLFTKDKEKWLHFYSVTAREYEYQMFHYKKQKFIRMNTKIAKMSNY